jgi:hypothetical protein
MFSLLGRMVRVAGGMYALLLLWTAYHVQYPSKCPHAADQGLEEYRFRCIEPFISSQRLDVRLYISLVMSDVLPTAADLVWSRLNISTTETLDDSVTIPIPSQVRIQQQTLYGYVVLGEAEGCGRVDRSVVVRLQLTELKPRRPSNRQRNLLTEPSAAPGLGHVSDLGLLVQHWKYGQHPLILRRVELDIVLGSPQLPMLMHDLKVRHVIEDRMDPQSNTPRRLQLRQYEPIIWVDDVAITRSQYVELSRNLSMASPLCRLRLTPASLLHFGYKKMMGEVLRVSSSLINNEDLDEIRWWLSDDRLFRYFLTQFISVHNMIILPDEVL